MRVKPQSEFLAEADIHKYYGIGAAAIGIFPLQGSWLEERLYYTQISRL